jgi:hypothetical protein
MPMLHVAMRALPEVDMANVGAYISPERNLLATFGNVGTLTGTCDCGPRT